MTQDQCIPARLQHLPVAGKPVDCPLQAAERGLCVDGLDAPTVVLTVEEVARIVAVAIDEDGLAELQDWSRRRVE